MENLIVIGTGCAGLTAAIYGARAGLEPLVLEGTQPGGQLTTTSEVENFPGFPDGIDGFVLMDNLRRQAKRFGARFETAAVVGASLDGACKRLMFESGRELVSRAMIVATGARPRLLGIPGEKELFGGKGVTTCATCDGAFYRDMDVFVVGGGDSACEEALFLTRFCSKVTMLVRRDVFRASRIMEERVLKHPKIEVLWRTRPLEVCAGSDGMMRGVRIEHLADGTVSEIDGRGFFIAIGHIPNTDFLEGQLERDADGYLVAGLPSGVTTTVPGVFVAGDCADRVYRQAVTAAGTGCRAAIEAERWLAEQD